jgi:hypothetical protein
MEMSRLRYLNPFRIRAAVRDIKRVHSGGGPARVRLARVGEPEGLIIPTSEIVLEVQARDGTVSRFAPSLPVPWPYAWAWRVARLLGVPLVRSFDPDSVRLDIGVPGRS